MSEREGRPSGSSEGGSGTLGGKEQTTEGSSGGPASGSGQGQSSPPTEVPMQEGVEYNVKTGEPASD